MEEDKKESPIKGWFNRFDEKLKSLKETHLKHSLLKSEIIENQLLLEEYKMDKQNNKIKIKPKRIDLLNHDLEKGLIKRVNIKNYAELDHDNLVLKRLLDKIKERKETIKNGKKLIFKRYKTNNDYGNINYLFQNNAKNQITSKENENKSDSKRLVLRLSTNRIEPQKDKTDNIIKKDRPLLMKYKTNLILDLNNEKNNNKEYSIKDIINYNYNKNKTEGNVNCFFETLSHEDNYGIKNSGSKKYYIFKNMIKMIKMVREGLHNCELSGNILNKNIEKTRNILKLSNSASKNKNKRKLVLNINYSRIKDIRDVEKQIFTQSNENIKNNKSMSKLKIRNTRNKSKENDNNKLNKKFLILPICTPSNKSYLKKNDNIKII